jgi:hypothetical protein
MTNKPTWELEWEKLTEMPDYKDFGKLEESLYREDSYPESMYELCHDKIKDFISTKLAEQRLKIAEEIELKFYDVDYVEVYKISELIKQK